MANTLRILSICINLKDNKGKALEVAQNVLHEIERDFVLGNKLIKISASIGIAVYCSWLRGRMPAGDRE